MDTELTTEETAELTRRLTGVPMPKLSNLLAEASHRVVERARTSISEDGSGGVGGFMNFTASSPDGPIEVAGEFKGELWCEVLAILGERQAP